MENHHRISRTGTIKPRPPEEATVKVWAAILVGVLLATIAPWPSVTAAATAEPAFPPADLQRAERAPELVAWIYERLALSPPNLTDTSWENHSADFPRNEDMGIAATFWWVDGLGYQHLGYTPDGFVREGSIDVDSDIRASDRTEGSLRTAALEVAARLGFPSDGMHATVRTDGPPYVMLDGSLPWGTPVHAQSIFIKFGGANLSVDRLVFEPWFTGAGTPTVAAGAAQDTALSAASARGGAGPLHVVAVGASVTNGTHPAWVVTIGQGSCSSETSYYYVDGETGQYLGRRGGAIADGVCNGLSQMVIIGVIGGAAAIAAVVVWRRRKLPKPTDEAP